MAAPGHQTDLISIYTFSGIAAEVPAVTKTPRILVAPRPRVLGDHKLGACLVRAMQKLWQTCRPHTPTQNSQRSPVPYTEYSIHIRRTNEKARPKIDTLSFLISAEELAWASWTQRGYTFLFSENQGVKVRQGKWLLLSSY